jgi:hypothetical protein
MGAIVWGVLRGIGKEFQLNDIRMAFAQSEETPIVIVVSVAANEGSAATVAMPEASKRQAGRLSEATPPDANPTTPRIPEGCQPNGLCRLFQARHKPNLGAEWSRKTI